MPNTFVQVPIETEPDNLAQLAFQYLQTRYPDWQPSDGQLDTWLISALARQAAELRDVASDVPAAIFRYFGSQLMRIPPIDAVAATIPVTVTMKDATGYNLPANSLVAGLRDASGNLKGYANRTPVVIAPGATAVAATLTATEDGAASSGLGVPATVLELITSIERVASVAATATSSNGLDAEPDLTYLNRLAANLALQAPRPILAPDFAVFAKNTPGVGRALALDGYDAVALTNNNARTVTVALADIAGQAVAPATKTAVTNALQAAREINFLIYVIDPAYTTIDVQWDVNAYPGWSSATVTGTVNTQIAAFLNAAKWGNPPYGDADQWIQATTVRFRDLIGAVFQAQGVKDVNFVKIRTGAGAYLEQDIVMTGPAPLPVLGANTGVVH